MENIKTLGELLQEVVEKDDNFYSLHEFLLYSTEEDRQRIEKMLTDADYKQFIDYMDGFSFVSEDEIHSACVDYFEKSAGRGISIGESVDLYDVADDYMREKGLVFDD